jgi:hypothetical protein
MRQRVGTKLAKPVCESGSLEILRLCSFALRKTLSSIRQFIAPFGGLLSETSRTASSTSRSKTKFAFLAWSMMPGILLSGAGVGEVLGA